MAYRYLDRVLCAVGGDVKRPFIESPAAWLTTPRTSHSKADDAQAIERDPRRSGNDWMDWLLLAAFVGLVGSLLA